MTPELERAREKPFSSLRKQAVWKAALDAMERVPREQFVPPALRRLSYEDVPLSIGRGQTISQPYIVALMTHALELRPDDRALELGTGSGYQAAVLSLLARRVYTVERIASLAKVAASLLDSLGYCNVEVHAAGDALGLREHAPYDAIAVTAAAPTLPRALLEQLEVGGRLVIPVGSQDEQWLMKVTRKKDGYSTSNLGSCRFVPLLGKGAW